MSSVVVDEVAYDGQIFCLSVIEVRLLTKVFGEELGGSLFQTIVFCGGGVCLGFSFGIQMEWSRRCKPLELEFSEKVPALILMLFG